MSGPAIGVALAPVSRRVDVDPLTGAVTPDRVPPCASAADLAALEVALRLAEAWQATVTAVTVGSDAAEPLLRDALARGADDAIRVEPGNETSPPGMPPALAATAEALAVAFGDRPVVLCGEHGDDGGTGTVPALLAAHGDRAQALGLTAVEPGPEPGTVSAERRLDRGWRERLLIRAPMVLSVESGAGRIRRAALPAVLAARQARIPVLSGAGPTSSGDLMIVAPYRPPARVVPVPVGASPLERVVQVIGIAADREPPRRVEAEPSAAAAEIFEQLRRWGYL